MVKVGNISLDMTIQMILRDKGCLTKKQIKDYLKKVEITDEEFRQAWKLSEDWGLVRVANRVVENGREVWTYEFRDDYNSTSWFDKQTPKMWDILLDDGKQTTSTNIRIYHRVRDKDKIVEAIKQIPIIIDAEEVKE